MEHFYEGAFRYERDYTNHLVLSEYVGDPDANVIVIPQEVKGEPVTVIGERAFCLCQDVEIRIPASVAEIRWDAWAGGSGIALVPDPDSPYFRMEDGILYDRRKTQVVKANSDLCGKVILPDTVEMVRDYAFYGCENLKEIEIPQGCERIGSYAFGGCRRLEKVNWLGRKGSLGAYVFYDCKRLKRFAMPADCHDLTEGLFCQSGMQQFAFPSKCERIPERCFADTPLEEVKIPETCREICENAFRGCWRLEHVKIPDACRSIDSGAFAMCGRLWEAEVAEGTQVHMTAFWGCGSGYTLEEQFELKWRKFKYNINKWFDKVETIWIESYFGADDIVEIPAQIEDRPVVGLGSYAFNQSPEIALLKIPKTMNFISQNAWEGCRPKQIELDPENSSFVMKEDMLFSKDRSKLLWCSPKKTGELTIPLTVKKIFPVAFMGCDALEKVVVPAGCEEIGEYAFSDCTALKQVILPQRDLELGACAFEGCKALTEISLPEDWDCLPYGAFQDTGLSETELLARLSQKRTEAEEKASNFYCLMMMTTTKKGAGKESAFGGKGDAMSYELKVICGSDEADLLRNCMEQRRNWLRTHPDYEALGFSEDWIEEQDEYALEVLDEGTAEEYLLDVLMEPVYRTSEDRRIRCEITTFDCYAKGFWQLKYELYHQDAHLPSTPGDFDTMAIEEADAWDMLHGEFMDEANYWNRYNWVIRDHIDLDREGKTGLDKLNAELYRIAHEPRLGVNELQYFESVH